MVKGTSRTTLAYPSGHGAKSNQRFKLLGRNHIVLDRDKKYTLALYTYIHTRGILTYTRFVIRLIGVRLKFKRCEFPFKWGHSVCTETQYVHRDRRRATTTHRACRKNKSYTEVKGTTGLQVNKSHPRSGQQHGAGWTRDSSVALYARHRMCYR